MVTASSKMPKDVVSKVTGEQILFLQECAGTVWVSIKERLIQNFWLKAKENIQIRWDIIM